MDRINGTWTLKELWELACDYDGIPRDSKFVVFSNGNPYSHKHNIGMSMKFQAMKS